MLVVTHKPPFPKIDGGCMATAQVVIGLEKSDLEYKIACIETSKHPFLLEEFPKTIRKKILYHHYLKTTSFLGNVMNWLNGAGSIFMLRFYDKQFATKLINACHEYKPDIIHFESLFAAVYLNDLKKTTAAKMLLRTHNIEHQLWRDRLKNAHPIKRFLLKNQVDRLRLEEIEVFKQVDGIAAIASNEIDFIVSNTILTPAIHIPMGFDLATRESSCGSDFFHLAAMDWQPNVDALNWFLNEVWQHDDLSRCATLHLAGKSLEVSSYRDFAGVKNHGMVRDSNAFMGDYGIMLVPLFEGSGLRIKIIEAGALGVPIIATSKAVEGIGLVPNVHYIEANQPNEFRNAMQLLANDVSLRQNLGAAIRSFIQRNYNQDIFNNQLIEFYHSI